MKFVKAAPNSSGAYQGPRPSPSPAASPTDGQAETLVAYNGFVTITPGSPTRRSRAPA